MTASVMKFHEAAVQGNLHGLEGELMAGRCHVDSPSRLGETALMISARKGDDTHLLCLKMLLRMGADVDARSKFDETPLILAARTGRIKCLRTLLKHGAFLEAQDYDQDTALIEAARNGHVDCLYALLYANAEVDACNIDGNSALHAAAQNGHTAIVQALLEPDMSPMLKSIRCSVDVPDHITNLIVEFAAWRIPDITHRNARGDFALDLAEDEGYSGIWRYLYDRMPKSYTSAPYR